jgi:hypothetical protein
MGIAVAREGEIIDGNTELQERPKRVEAGETEPGRVAVLGCGPAGLLAAHAVALAGHEPLIISARAVKSEIPGAVYLHKPIPDLTSNDPDAMIQFVKRGTREGYAYKVYGSRYADCSWDRFDEGEQPAWVLQSVYDDLWDRYGDQIAEQEIDHEAARMLAETFPLVVSTIPAFALCQSDEHSFRSRTIWINKRAQPECADHGDPVIIYDGRIGSGCEHYRTSLIFGHGATEYGVSQPMFDCVRGTKPLGTDCDCLPEVLRVGRFGTWRPGVLAHQAFEVTFKRMFEGLEGSDEMQ